jgi:hypothetical protein
MVGCLGIGRTDVAASKRGNNQPDHACSHGKNNRNLNMKGGISKRAEAELRWQAIRRHMKELSRIQGARPIPPPKEKKADNQGKLEL